MTNKYDQGYEAKTERMASQVHDSYWKKKEEDDWDAEYKAGAKDAEARKPRNKVKSFVANDTDYQSFLAKIATALGLKEIREEYVSVDWVTGGMTGGNCWGDSADRAVSADPPAELEDLDRILEAVSPDISFLKYKNLCAEIVRTHEYTNSEYYGNYYEHMVKYVLFQDLYDALKKRGMI